MKLELITPGSASNPVLNAAGGIGGMFSGGYLTLPSGGGSTANPQAANSVAANVILALRFVLPCSLKLSRVKIQVAAALAGSNVGCAIYNGNGNLVIDSGNISGAAIGSPTAIFTPVILKPGTYYFAFSASTAITLTTVNLVPGNLDGTFHPNWGRAANAWSSVTGFPATLGAITNQFVTFLVAFWDQA